LFQSPSPQSIPTLQFNPFGCDWPPVPGVWPSNHSKDPMSFSILGLSEALLRAVAQQGYSCPTPIQARAIPAILAGGDLLAAAQTGTGKTAGFVLPMLQRLSAGPAASARDRRVPVRGLILAPTRELALQVEASVRAYGRFLSLSSIAVIGGVGLQAQAKRLRQGVDIVVATPGRLLDHHAQRNIDLGRVEVFVLDEADRMLDMGFIRDIRRVMALMPKRRQSLLFSATFSDEIRALAGALLDSPSTIEAAPRNATLDAIDQRIHPVARERKRELLSSLIGRHGWRQVLVFTRTKHGADKLAKQLGEDGIPSLAIHGNKTQSARTQALHRFKGRDVRVLVATDIAARGIDIDELPLVVNYDLPNVPEDYVHRIGRTGRAGSTGQAISLVCVDEHGFLREIERVIRKAIPRHVVEGFEPSRFDLVPSVPSRTPARQPGRGRTVLATAAASPNAARRREGRQVRYSGREREKRV
jgi:ATP-dependent RNA helicase RhlE